MESLGQVSKPGCLTSNGAPCSQPRLLGCNFFRRSHSHSLAQHPPFQQISKPEALCWCIPIQALHALDFEKQVLVIACFMGALCMRTIHRRFAVVMDMVWKQDKTSPIPQAALNAL